MILLSGPPGSGKSTFARRLSRAMALVHLESDAIRRELFGRPRYDTRESGVVFAEMRRRAGTALASGSTVLIDATNLLERQRRMFSSLARSSGRPYVGVRLWAADGEIRARLRRPRTGYSTAGEAVYLRMRGSEEFQEDVHLVVHTGTDAAIQASVEAVRRLVNSR